MWARIKQRVWDSRLSVLIGKISVIEPLYSLLRLLFYNANKELYRKSLIKVPIIRFSVSNDLVRTPMYAAIFAFLDGLSKKEEIRGKKAIEVGGSEGSMKAILEEFGLDVEIAPNYPEVDIHNLPYQDDMYDFLVLDQVLEHIEKPWEATREIFRVLKPGGILIATGPFMLGYHGTDKYLDYWRFTPAGWRSLFSQFEILEADGWGNDLAIQVVIKASPAPAPWYAISAEEAIRKKFLEYNDRRHYLFTWCIARKPLISIES